MINDVMTIILPPVIIHPCYMKDTIDVKDFDPNYFGGKF